MISTNWLRNINVLSFTWNIRNWLTYPKPYLILSLPFGQQQNLLLHAMKLESADQGKKIN